MPRMGDDEIELFRVIHEDGSKSEHPIRPDDIDPALIGTFQKYEVERVVEKLILFFQSRGYWSRFTFDELSRFYRDKGWNPVTAFYGLTTAYFDDGGMMNWRQPLDIFIAQGENGMYCVTDRFIERCGRSRKKPATQAA